MIEWDERKRAANLAKHHLHFADAWRVHESPLTERKNDVRAISLRRASRAERRMYEKAIEKEPD